MNNEITNKIMALFMANYNRKQIAEQMGISYGSVFSRIRKRHKQNLIELGRADNE